MKPAEIDADGQLSRYSGSLEIGAGLLVADAGAKPLKFEGAKGYFEYDPAIERLTFPELTLRTDAFEISGRGHMLLREFDGSFPTQFVSQFDIDHLSADPRDVFQQPIEFDQGSVDLQLTLDPFSVRLGQIALRRDALWLRGRGAALATPDGWSVSVDAGVDSMQASELMSLWPETAIPKTRAWLTQNILAATYNDLQMSLRLAPGAQTPQTHLAWNFEQADVRFMKSLPPVTQGAGYGTISGNALTLVVQEGAILAPSGGDINVAGTVLRIPQLNIKPATLAVQLKTSSGVEAAVSLMAQKPFEILKGATLGLTWRRGRRLWRGNCPCL